MPIPENRRSIERALAAKRRRRLGLPRNSARIEPDLLKIQAAMTPEQFARVQEQFLKAASRIGFQFRNRKRRDDGSMPALVEPPRGPMPKSGGAAAALEFDD